MRGLPTNIKEDEVIKFIMDAFKEWDNENEEERIKDITDHIVKLVPKLINKEMDSFSSKVNQNLNGI